MKMLEKKFFKAGMIFSVFFLTCVIGLAQEFKTLEKAFSEIAFNPNAKGSFFFVVGADAHIGAQGGSKKFASQNLTKVVGEINKFRYRPDFMVIMGDLTDNITLARCREFKKHISLLRKDIKLYLTTGNHDASTDLQRSVLNWPYEKNNPDYARAYAAFRNFFNIPLYFSCNHNGFHMVFLNGHATGGNLDPTQLKWLKDDLKTAGEREIIIFCHQGIAAFEGQILKNNLDEAFKDYKKNLWIFNGHWHRDYLAVRQFNGQKWFLVSTLPLFLADYMLVCIQDKKVIAAFRKKAGKSFKLIPAPDKWRKLNVPLEELKDDKTILKVTVPKGDTHYIYPQGYQHHIWGSARFLKNVAYRIPLTGKSRKPLSLDVALTGECTIDLSLDGLLWYEVVNTRKGCAASLKYNCFDVDAGRVLEIKLPPRLLRQKQFFFRINSTDSWVTQLYGFALVEQ
ncbi:MAG: metallophosphoesterase [Victivallales bacterium]